MARANLKIKVGFYTGNGTAHRVISGIGFQPRMVMFWGENTNDPSIKFENTPRTVTDKLPGAVAVNTNCEFNADGWNTDGNTATNPSAVDIHYIAFGGTNKGMAIGGYMGDGADNRTISDSQQMPFTPTIIGLKAQTQTQGMCVRTPSMTLEAVPIFNASVFANNRIQSIVTNGFVVGSDTPVNASATRYSYFAFPALPKTMSATGTYTGTGVAQSITGLQFKPDFLLIKGDTAQQAVVATSTMDVGFARPISATTYGSNYINSLDSYGFTVGTDGRTNSNGATYHYWALKAGDYNINLGRSAVSQARTAI